MVYTHTTDKGEWDLWHRKVMLKGGTKTQTLYFFCKHGNTPKSGDPLDSIPEGKGIGVNKRTGLPYLKNE